MLSCQNEQRRCLFHMPQRCPWLTGEYIPRNAYRFILFEKRYMIIFQIIDDIVYADYVVDCRQDYDLLFPHIMNTKHNMNGIYHDKKNFS